MQEFPKQKKYGVTNNFNQKLKILQNFFQNPNFTQFNSSHITSLPFRPSPNANGAPECH
jgi:hypothetical protein